MDVSSRDSVHALVETASRIGDITEVIHAAGALPSRLRVNLVRFAPGAHAAWYPTP